MAASETDIAWLAGLYEGEGCLTRNKRKGITRGWILVITMQDEDVLRRAHAIAGVGRFRPARMPGPHPYWTWNVCAMDDLAALVPKLLPYLGERRAARCREYLAWQETRD